jgi:hypothetical protein
LVLIIEIINYFKVFKLKRKKVKIYIAYTHDDENHKKWVKKLKDNLEVSGFEVTFDQDNPLGTHIPLFMESISAHDYVLWICTPNFKEKCNDNAGGISYEKIFALNELSENVHILKHIPLIKKGKDNDSIPYFLKGRYYIDFRTTIDFDKNCKELKKNLKKVQ